MGKQSFSTFPLLSTWHPLSWAWTGKSQHCSLHHHLVGFLPFRLCSLQYLACRDGRATPRWKRNRAVGGSRLCPSGCAELLPRIVEQPSTATEAISQIWDLPASPVSAVTLLTHVLTSPALGWMSAGELHQKPTHGAPWNGKSGMCWLLLLDNYTRVWPGASQSFVVSMSCSHPWQQVPFSAEDLWEPWLVQISDVSWGPQQAARSSRVHWWKLNALFWMLCFPLGCRARGSQCNIGTT